jgi:hypothetical protein
MAERTYQTVDIERRGYGRRYTWLPVDSLTREGFWINLEGSLMRPAMYDIQVGDIVRWREGERYVEAHIIDVQRGETDVSVRFNSVHPLPPEHVQL